MGGVIEVIGFRFDRPSVTPAGVQIALRAEDCTEVDSWYKKLVKKARRSWMRPQNDPGSMIPWSSRTLIAPRCIFPG